MDKWNHKGVEINTTEKGTFRAHVGGIDVEQPTFEACKVLVDRILKKNITRPKVLVQDYNGWRIGEVTSLDNSSDKYYYFWVTDENGKRGKFPASRIYQYNENVASRVRKLHKILEDAQKELDEIDHKLIHYNSEELKEKLGLTDNGGKHEQ